MELFRALWRLNPQFNLFEHKATTRVATVHTDGGTQVLTKIEGPGIVTRLARTSDAGRLAFYFDDEETPRIECATAELLDRVVRVGEVIQGVADI